MFNQKLLENGYARLYESTFSKYTEFSNVESNAQSSDTGAWGYTEPDPPSEQSGANAIQIAQIHEDARGDEYDNLDDEYVVIENTGEDAVDMGG